MNFIYYIMYYMLTFMLSYPGPVYAEIDVVKEFEVVEDDVVEQYAQNDIEVGELPSGKIKIFVDKEHTMSAVVDKQDCNIMRKDDNTLALGWKFGGLMWGFGPEIKVGHSSGVQWKSDVQRMVAEYQELCTQFNTGRLSQEEYQSEKQQIIQRGYNYAHELEKRFKQKKIDMFKEMDEGKYISLQNSRFFDGCCYYFNKSEESRVAKLSPNEYSQEYNKFYDDITKKYNKFGNNTMNEFLDFSRRVSAAETRHWNSLTNNNRHHRHHRRHNRDLNWDVHGNSNGNWNFSIEKRW